MRLLQTYYDRVNFAFSNKTKNMKKKFIFVSIKFSKTKKKRKFSKTLVDTCS